MNQELGLFWIEAVPYLIVSLQERIKKKNERKTIPDDLVLFAQRFILLGLSDGLLFSSLHLNVI